jgi:hypothetical protein
MYILPQFKNNFLNLSKEKWGGEGEKEIGKVNVIKY